MHDSRSDRGGFCAKNEVIVILCKYCTRCHKQLKIGEKCSCTYKTDHKVCMSDDFYNSKDWRKVREECIRLCCGLDLYSLSKGLIEYGYTVHHIEPVDLAPNLKLSQSNLIYLTESNHKLIHSMYASGQYHETIIFLKDLKRMFVERGVGRKLFF